MWTENDKGAKSLNNTQLVCLTGLLGMLLGASIPAEASDSNSAPAIADYRSKHLAVGLSRKAPAFSFFSVDSLGQGKVALNPVLQKTNTVAGLTLDENLKDMKWGRDNYDKLGNTADADAFSAMTARIKAVYAKTFLNPHTGVLAGWKSTDGQLHDYWFTFVNGAATTGATGRAAATAMRAS